MFHTLNTQVKRVCPEGYFDDDSLPSRKSETDPDTSLTCKGLHGKGVLRRMQTCGAFGSASPSFGDTTNFPVLYDSGKKRQRLSDSDSFASSGFSTTAGLSTLGSSQDGPLTCDESLNIDCEEILDDDDFLDGFGAENNGIDEESECFSRASLDSFDQTLLTDEDLEVDQFCSNNPISDHQQENAPEIFIGLQDIAITDHDTQLSNTIEGREEENQGLQLADGDLLTDGEEYSCHCETYSHFLHKENDKRPLASSLEVKQSHLNWSMRVILIQWLAEVCAEIGLKRDTLHMCVHYIDSYIGSHNDIPREHFQLLGATSLWIAAKVEEVYAPRVKHITHSTNNAYSEAEITDMEMKILTILGWDTTPITLNTWTHWFMRSWDFFYQSTSSGLTLHGSLQSEDSPSLDPEDQAAENFTSLLFKNPDANSYKRFRSTMQILDTVLLDHDHLAINNYRAIVLATMYCVLAKEINVLDESAVENFMTDASLLMFSKNIFNDAFRDFIEFAADFSLENLLPAVSYVIPFIRMEFDYQPPKVAHYKQEEIENHYEEFLSYQTFTEHSAQFLSEIRKVR
mmetsp:Transcript_39894/g.45507  ORF Transcript_39894/g.45507 Transcript_39894/m.45507 type:complete len:571 (+) Transcript_39894:2104-3816(+)